MKILFSVTIALFSTFLAIPSYADFILKGHQVSVADISTTREILVLENSKKIFKAVGQITLSDNVFVVSDCMTLAESGLVQSAKCLNPTDSAKLTPTQIILAK